MTTWTYIRNWLIKKKYNWWLYVGIKVETKN